MCVGVPSSGGWLCRRGLHCSAAAPPAPPSPPPCLLLVSATAAAAAAAAAAIFRASIFPFHFTSIEIRRREIKHSFWKKVLVPDSGVDESIFASIVQLYPDMHDFKH